MRQTEPDCEKTTLATFHADARPRRQQTQTCGYQGTFGFRAARAKGQYLSPAAIFFLTHSPQPLNRLVDKTFVDPPARKQKKERTGMTNLARSADQSATDYNPQERSVTHMTHMSGMAALYATPQNHPRMATIRKAVLAR